MKKIVLVFFALMAFANICFASADSTSVSNTSKMETITALGQSNDSSGTKVDVAPMSSREWLLARLRSAHAVGEFTDITEDDILGLTDKEINDIFAFEQVIAYAEQTAGNNEEESSDSDVWSQEKQEEGFFQSIVDKVRENKVLALGVVGGASAVGYAVSSGRTKPNICLRVGKILADDETIDEKFERQARINAALMMRSERDEEIIEEVMRERDVASSMSSSTAKDFCSLYPDFDGCSDFVSSSDIMMYYGEQCNDLDIPASQAKRFAVSFMNAGNNLLKDDTIDACAVTFGAIASDEKMDCSIRKTASIYQKDIKKAFSGKQDEITKITDLAKATSDVTYRTSVKDFCDGNVCRLNDSVSEALANKRVFDEISSSSRYSEQCATGNPNVNQDGTGDFCSFPQEGSCNQTSRQNQRAMQNSSTQSIMKD